MCVCTALTVDMREIPLASLLHHRVFTLNEESAMRNQNYKKKKKSKYCLLLFVWMMPGLNVASQYACMCEDIYIFCESFVYSQCVCEWC